LQKKCEGNDHRLNGKTLHYSRTDRHGGSDLGPRALYLALKDWARGTGGRNRPRSPALISNVDPDDANAVLQGIDYERTLFILVTKSGTTQETLTNLAFVKQKMKDAGINGSTPRSTSWQ
jgi:glucose-6-phosphate isomerase